MFNKTREKPLISIIIKAFNEESCIESAIASVKANTQHIRSEIILADSLSTDRTVELAASLGIAILQLTDPAQRSCGIGAEMGFRHAEGDFMLLMDGDMQLVDGFLEAALEKMSSDSSIAAVGGQIQEQNIHNLEFATRAKAAPKHLQAGEVDRLTGGGLFRRSALQALGYFTNRNLHAFEELELGLRLRTAGYRLVRIDRTCFIHYGHKVPTIHLLWMRIKTGYAKGSGEILRASIGQPWFAHLVFEFRAFVAALIWWLMLALSLLLLPWTALPVSLVLLAAVIAIAIMTKKKKSLRLGAYAPVAWSVFALNGVIGFLKRPLPVTGPLPMSVVR